ncbi:MAG: hypothetical protein PSX79_00780 [bacterium]|nr:hypothetical protein [bacterium]
MVPIILAPRGKGGVIGRPITIEHLGRGAVSRDAFAPQIAKVHGQRRGPIPATAMTDDPTFDDDTSIAMATWSPRIASTARTPKAAAAFQVQRAQPTAPGGSDHLLDKATRLADAAGAAIADAPQADEKLVIVGHRVNPSTLVPDKPLMS